MVYLKKILAGLLFLCFAGSIAAQPKYLFKRILFDSSKNKLYKIFITKRGETMVLSSTGLWRLKNGKLIGPVISNQDIYKDTQKVKHEGNSLYHYWNIRKIDKNLNDAVRGSLAQSLDSSFYFISYNKLFVWKSINKISSVYWPTPGFNQTIPVIKIWLDSYGNIYAGTDNEGFHKTEIEKTFGEGKNNNDIVKVEIKQVSIKFFTNISVYSFAQDPKKRDRIWMGTSWGLFYYNINEGTSFPVIPNDKKKITITEIYTDNKDDIWFSTLEKGMGVYNIINKRFQFFPYRENNVKSKFPVKTFCYKSPHEFFVAISDYFPAVFDTKSHTYTLLYDSVLSKTSYQTTEVKVDGRGNLLFLKGGNLYYSDTSEKNLIEPPVLKTIVQNDSSSLIPFIKKIELSDGTPLATLDYRPELLQKIALHHNQNNLIVYCDAYNFDDKKEIQFAWNLEGYTSGWLLLTKTTLDNSTIIELPRLNPGKYKLQVRVKIGYNNWHWQSNIAELIIIITTPIWKKWWFWAIAFSSILIIVGFFFWWHVKTVQRKDRERLAQEKQMLELEAKALRAQMNPHFIFNCMNSIKSLMQEGEIDKGVTYLTTFSKLIRTLFNNADKKEISLYDEIETCKLYLQLEAMRFDTKFSYTVNVDEQVDLKSILVPALIVQPFIENAIWHGIVPKGGGGNVSLSVLKNDGAVEIVIDDDGIGREASQQNKAASNIGHQSKGVNLTESRLKLDNLLQQRQARMEIFDKKDENGIATGTKVIVRIPQEE